MANKKDCEPREFASAPCSLHELEPEFAGTASWTDIPMTPDLAAWRRAERERLIEMRLATRQAERAVMDDAIITRLLELVVEPEGKVISAYWPFRAEPDLRPLLKRLAAIGARTALPVVVEKGRPLVFREWKSGDPLERGIWNIPFPSNGAEILPDIVIAPVVGFDSRCFRLGYGGGFFDRTLAALPQKPLCIGVGYAFQRLATIRPHHHDIAMDAIATDVEIIQAASA